MSSMTFDVYRRMSAAQKSFVTPAVITLVLYFVFWIPGLVANIVWLLEANNAKRISGRDPEGRGCLIALIAIPGILFGLAICVWFVILGGALSSA